MVRSRAASGLPVSSRKPPYSEEAERGVLGSALLDPSRVVDLCIERQLETDSFYTQTHRHIFEALHDMSQKNAAIDVLTVGEWLKQRGVLEEAGGAGYLDELVDSTPTAAHAEYYIKIVYDKHLLRRLIRHAEESIEKCYTSEDEAENILNKAEESIYQISENKKEQVAKWEDLLNDAVNDINMIVDQRKSVTGLPTGYANIDKILQGLQPSDMIVLAARPSMGKTALALNIAERVAMGREGSEEVFPVGIFSLEMSSEALVRRMLCTRARVESSVLRSAFMSNNSHGRLIQAADSLRKAQIYIDDSAGLSALELRSRARRMQSRFGIKLLVVDYLQMMNHPGASRDGRQQEVAKISNTVKAIAKELKIPVLILSQLSRNPESRDKSAKPRLSDLRDSGSIEQDADVVILLRRPCRYPSDEQAEDRTLAILDIAKHRNGATGEVHLNFEETYTRFEDRVEIEEAPAPVRGGEF